MTGRFKQRFLGQKLMKKFCLIEKDIKGSEEDIQRFNECLNSFDWIIHTQEQKDYYGLNVGCIHFYNPKIRENETFYIINNVIAVVPGKFCESVTICGDDW